MLLSELDAAGHTNALETPLLLSSNIIVADIELDQGPVVLDANSKFLGEPWSVSSECIETSSIAGKIKLLQH
jgi:hypothetical protein